MTFRSSSILFRSMFFPKNTRASIEKTAATLNPDIICLDLEDSVHHSERSAVKRLYEDVLRNGLLSKFTVIIRTSSLDEKDEISNQINTFVGLPGLFGFLLPKVESPDSVVEIDRLITKVEKEKGLSSLVTKLIPDTESPEAYFHLDKIALASKRNVALGAASGDFTTGMVCDDHSLPYDAFFSKAVIAARAAGIGAIWGVHDKIDDDMGFENACLKMKRAGYNGVSPVTPKQITIANSVFSMTQSDSDWIDQVLKTKDTGIDLLQISMHQSRQMIGPPHHKKAAAMKQFYPTLSVSTNEPSIKGIMPVKSSTINTSIGEIVQIPDKMKIDDSLRTLWCCLFPSRNVESSHLLTEIMGLSRDCLPFTLVYNLSVSLLMSSFGSNVKHLSSRNILQNKPLPATR